MYEFIIWVSYLAIKAHTHSDGSSPVTTTPLLNHFLVTQHVFISMQAYWFVRIDMPFLQIINQNIYKFCLDRNYEKYDFCMDLPLGLKIKPIKKHKG